MSSPSNRLQQSAGSGSERLGVSVVWSYAFAVLLLLFIFVILAPERTGPSPWDGEAVRESTLELFANFRILDDLADLGFVKVADVGEGFVDVNLDLMVVSGRRFGWGPFYGSPKVHVGPELAEGAPGGPVTGAFPGFSLGVLVMGQGPVEARGKRAVFSKARWARLCVRGAGSFHRACPFVTSGPRGALLHLPRVQLVKSRCPYDLRCTCVIFQPERWGPNSQTLAPLRVRAHRGDHAL